MKCLPFNAMNYIADQVLGVHAVLLKMLIVAQLAKIFLAFYMSKGALLRSPELANGPYPEKYVSSSQPHILFPKGSLSHYPPSTLSSFRFSD
jgi:hypothetical protein